MISYMWILNIVELAFFEFFIEVFELERNKISFVCFFDSIDGFL